LIIDFTLPWGEADGEEAINLDIPGPLSSISTKGLFNMKTSLAIAALSLVSLGVANTATAASDFYFKNKGAFTATGSITVSTLAVSLPCTATLTGTTTGGAKITAATFSGGGCTVLTAGNLPWHLKATASHSISIKKMEVSALGLLGICGPDKVKAQLNANGVVLITSAQLSGSILPCSVSANLATKPHLEILEKK